MRIKTSAVKKIRTLTRNARAIAGNASAKTSASKNVDWTRGQPGEFTMTRPTTASTTIVLAVAMMTAVSARRTLPHGVGPGSQVSGWRSPPDADPRPGSITRT